MRLSSAATVGILLGLALMLGACGEDGSSAADKPASVSSASSTSAPAPKKARTLRACHQLRGFVGSMSALRDRLARGLSYDDYLREVQSVHPLYRDIDAGKLTLGCLLTAGGPAERAFNLYIDAANTWGDCLATVSCNTRSIEPRLQRKWALAARRLAVAQRGLRRG
jgi:hypothetical protein